MSNQGKVRILTVLTIRNPYSNDLTTWQRGVIHAHTTNSDGALAPQEVVDDYAARGYGFLMIADHDWLTDPAALDPRGMALIPGVEVTARGPHILHVNATQALPPHADRQKVLDAIQTDGGFAVVNHPNWERSYSHCRQEWLESWTGYLGIEIYNAVVRRQEGSPLATDRWDRLLGQGRRVWGFANDDMHLPEDAGQAWNVIQCESRDGADVLRCLREGRFYASTGVEITGIRVEGLRLRVETTNAQRILVISDFGHREACVDATAVDFTLDAHAPVKYVRVECWGPGEAMAWTQPFYVEPGPDV
jgi:hypothetical protein